MRKFFAILIAALLILTLIACSNENGNEAASTQSTQATTTPPTQTAPSTSETFPTETDPPEALPTEPEVTEGWLAAYADLVEDFRKIIAYRMGPDFENEWDDGMQIPDVSDTLTNTVMNQVYRWGDMIVELPRGDKAATEAAFGYILHDLNADGTPELFWVHKDHTICAIFTYWQDTPVLLDAYWPRYSGYVNQYGQLYSLGSGGAQDTAGYILTLKDDMLLEVFEYGSETDSDGNAQYYQKIGDVMVFLDQESTQ